MENKFSLGKVVGLGVLGLVVVLMLMAVSSYNSLVGLDEKSKTAQADIEVQYQRRFDLIPNLVATVQGAAKLEQSIIDSIASARTRYTGAVSGSTDKINAMTETEPQVQSALSRLLVVAENYPQIKSTANFQSLQDQLEGTENRISVARSNYNEVVNEYDTRIRRFPSNIVAAMFGFNERPRFEVTTPGAKDAPEVKF